MWQRDKSPEAAGRLENLKELVRALADFETLSGFLDHVSLVMENDEAAEGDRVSLMTLHGAKGLEFDTVFLPGWEEGLFPNQRALDEGGVKSLEEERRLAYVGLTRARQRAIVSHAANRRIYANWQTSIPSRFIDEFPDGCRADRVGGNGTRCKNTRGDDFRRSVSACGPTPPHNRGMGPTSAPSTERCNSSWRSRVSREVRLRHRAGSGGRQAGRRVRKAGEKRVLDRFVEKVRRTPAASRPSRSRCPRRQCRSTYPRCRACA